MQQSDSTDPYIEPFSVQEQIRQGDSLLYILSFANGTGPLDISGYQFVFTAKRARTDPDSAAVAQTFYTAPAGTSSQSGQMSFEAITHAQSDLIPADTTYQMDVRYMTPASQVATIVEGTLEVVMPVSQNITPPP